MAGNQLSGPIPSWLGNLTQLVGIYVGENQLNGSIPESLSKLTNLEDLSLYSNQLGGTVKFDMFFNMTILKYLDLGLNNLSLLSKQGKMNAASSKFGFLGLPRCN
ncbi:LRR domain containing protein [Trema orientale]|uniref:LRR domain containing protein n=1 Tax=Trema orientale TaxID=63057 RepID=A0A2P5DA79_TREOI|nr:LRR domain containing protein [Trema orientale]